MAGDSARCTARWGVGLVVAALALAAPAARAGSVELAYAKSCRKAFTVQGRTYSLKRMGLVFACADKFLKCELLAEIDGQDPSSCRDAVTSACTGRLGPLAESALSKAAARFEAKVALACQPAIFDYADVISTGPGGLWFGNDAGCGASIDLPSLLMCLRDEVDARTDALVSALKPRTGLLLDNVGLGAGFPHLDRPPLADVVVGATGAGSGVLVNPGTIAVSAGTALRFTGDAATLGCTGSSSNGRVTITVGVGPTAERHVLHEPYAPESVAIFGPWLAPTTIPYTIELVDGSCQDTTTGDVSVP